jgi:hypothetical protein
MGFDEQEGSRRQGEDDGFAAEALAEEVQRLPALLPTRPPHRHQHRPGLQRELTSITWLIRRPNREEDVGCRLRARA